MSWLDYWRNIWQCAMANFIARTRHVNVHFIPWQDYVDDGRPTLFVRVDNIQDAYNAVRLCETIPAFKEVSG